MTRDDLAHMAEGLVRDGLLKRRGAWYELLVDIRLVPEHARRQVNAMKQITRRQGRTILWRTYLIKFHRGVRVGVARASAARRPTVH